MKHEVSELNRKYENQLKINSSLNTENILLKDKFDEVDEAKVGLRNALTAANDNLEKQKYKEKNLTALIF